MEAHVAAFLDEVSVAVRYDLAVRDDRAEVLRRLEALFAR
jgi:glycyl-tRNA synthetase beta subunit